MSGKTKSLEQGIRTLNDLAHRLDPTRPSTSAQVMMCGISSPMNRITDLQGYNLYFGWYVQTYHAIDQWLDQFHKAYPEIKLCLSEYGAEGIIKYQAEQGVQGDYSESYQPGSMSTMPGQSPNGSGSGAAMYGICSILALPTATRAA